METQLRNAMPDGTKLFMPGGASWVERAELGELKAVISPTASDRGNDFHHAVHVWAAKLALRRYGEASTILDFGCGTGRFVRFFGNHGRRVIGTDITFDMLAQAQRHGVPQGSSLVATDGVSLPLRDQSVHAIWCCGVLRYSLYVSTEVYEQIAQEMHRVLKPGGEVLNLEMYVDAGPERFTRGFERNGFTTIDIRVLKTYDSFLENCLKSRRWPRQFVEAAGQMWGALHYWLSNPRRKAPGLRDYLFVWKKAA